MSSAYIGVKEVRGQVPGTTCNGARTNSAINNTGHELHKSARGSGAVSRRCARHGASVSLGTEQKSRSIKARSQSLAPHLFQKSYFKHILMKIILVKYSLLVYSYTLKTIFLNDSRSLC